MALSCPQCSAAVLPGMRTCQFCGARTEFAEQSAEASAPPSTNDESSLADPAPQSPFQEARPEAPTLPANAELPRMQANVLAEPKPGNAKPAKTDLGKAAAKSRLRSFAVPAAAGLLALWLLLFLGYRLLSDFTGSGSSTAGSGAQSSSAETSGGGVTASGLGIDVYPGARALSAPDRSDSSGNTVVSQTFVSDDKMDQVIDFYKARMVGQTSIYASGNGVVVSISPNALDTIQVAIAPAGSGGVTRIAITHTTSNGSR